MPVWLRNGLILPKIDRKIVHIVHSFVDNSGDSLWLGREIPMKKFLFG